MTHIHSVFEGTKTSRDNRRSRAYGRGREGGGGGEVGRLGANICELRAVWYAGSKIYNVVGGGYDVVYSSD